MNIRQLFESRLAGWTQPKGLQVAWENAPFTPPSGIYLRAFLLRAATTSHDLEGVNRRYQGVFQVNVVAPVGGGSGAPEALAQEIEALFPQNLRLTEGGRTVMVIAPMAMRAPLQDDDRYTIPVSLRYRADTY
jgi:hypothetical protein